MFKTVSTDCNLDCSYCYYRESLEGARTRRRISDEMLERFIPDYLGYVADAGSADFAWQGGEPTLAGLEFFEKIVALQGAHARPGLAINNAIQTNAVLLDDDWGAFFKRHRWLVGVSLDGPAAVHDSLRTNKAGRGTFDWVMRGIDVLRRHAVDFNVLCVVGPHNVDKATELMTFFRQQRFTHVQFIPAMDFQALEPEKPAAYLITPEQYGEFLVTAFDLWYEDGVPTMSVRTFDNFLQSYVGVPNDLCVHADACNAGIVVEWDGSAYACDFYVHPSWKIGNVMENTLQEIATNALRLRFIEQKQPYPDECVKCEWLKVCKSGCYRNRGDDGKTPDYFSPSYKRFFAHADASLRELETAIRATWRYRRLQSVSPQLVANAGRNDPCPCGSSKKHKRCCQHPARAGSYLFTG